MAVWDVVHAGHTVVFDEARSFAVNKAMGVETVLEKCDGGWDLAFEAEAPLTRAGAMSMCRYLSPQQWPYCRTGRASAAPRRTNTLMLVSMPCAFTDAGSNFRGALYDARRVLSAQHRPQRGALDAGVQRLHLAPRRAAEVLVLAAAAAASSLSCIGSS